MVDPVRVDLHIHTALSPCADKRMAPPGVLLTAERLGIRAVGIVDHSAARNAWAFVEAAEAFDVRVFVGLEVESAEGVHILALFDSVEQATAMDEIVAGHLPPLPNRPDVLGPQLLVDEWGDTIGSDDRLLACATDMSIEQIALHTARLGGMSIPAHIDRSLNGLLPTLGFIPPRLQVDALELSPRMSPQRALLAWPQLEGRALVRSSDAHCLDEIGRACTWVSPRLVRAPLRAREWARALAHELSTGGPTG